MPFDEAIEIFNIMMHKYNITLMDKYNIKIHHVDFRSSRAQIEEVYRQVSSHEDSPESKKDMLNLNEAYKSMLKWLESYEALIKSFGGDPAPR